MHNGQPVRVVKRRQFLSNAVAFGAGFGMGTVAGLVIFLAAMTLSRASGHLIAFVVLVFCLVLPPILFVRGGHRIKSTGQAFLVGSGFSPGLFFVVSLFTLNEFFRMPGDVVLSILGVVLVLSGIYGALAVVVLFMTRKLGRPVVIQDGSLCPTCGYSLIGNTSMVCPECGSPFTFEDLDTTKEAFESLLEKSRLA